MPPPPTNRRIRVHLWLLLSLLLPGFHLACPGPALVPDGTLTEPKDEPKKPDEPGPEGPGPEGPGPEVPGPEGPGPEPDTPLPDTNQPIIDRINGNSQQGQTNVAASPSTAIKSKIPSGASQASNRIKDAIIIQGRQLEAVTKWVLTPTDSVTTNKELTWTGQAEIDGMGSNMMTLKFSNTKMLAVAGMFLLAGWVGNTKVVDAQVFVLQGEKGEKGDTGAKGSDSGITTAEATELKKLAPEATKLKNLASKLEATGTTLSFTAETITLKDQKGTLASFNGTKSTITSKALELNADSITLDADTFSVKAKNNTELTVDGGKRTISMSVEEADKNLKATFSVEGGDNTATSASIAKFPIARFSRANVMVQDGRGMTGEDTNSKVNGLGNLIVGYNEKRTGSNARTGSHNIIIGVEHNYSSHSGFASGKTHVISQPGGAVFGGESNTAGEEYSTVLGGSSQSTFGKGVGSTLTGNIKASSSGKCTSPYVSTAIQATPVCAAF